MGRRSRYTEEFHRDAVALPRTADGTRTYAAVTSDLGISGETLRTWVRTDNASGQGSAADHAGSFPKDSVWLGGSERGVPITGRSRSDGLDDVVDDALRGERREPALLVEPHVLPVHRRLRIADGGERDVRGARRRKRAGRRSGDDSTLAGATVEEIAVEGGTEKAGNVVDTAGSSVRRGRYGKGKSGAAEHSGNKTLHEDLDSVK